MTGRSPAAGATGVVIVNAPISATFSEPVQGVSGSTFTLKAGTTSVGATVSYDAASRVATLKPSANLAVNTLYTATLTGGASAIRDVANNPLATVSWTFTTAAAPADTTAPMVTSRNPGNSATSVSRTGNITATFSEPVSDVRGAVVSGTPAATFTLTNATTGTPVKAQVSYNATTRVATLNPDSTLAARTRFTVTLTGGTGAIRDTAGNPLTTVTWTFTTGR